VNIKRLKDSAFFRVRSAGREIAWWRQSVRSLENWSEVITDRLRTKFGVKLKCNELKLRDGLAFSLHPGSTGLFQVYLEVFPWSLYDGDPLFKLKKGDTVIDIGANIGLFTLKAARLVGEGRVYAYEPCSMHFNLLSENVRRNNQKNVQVFKEAVWKNSDALELLYSNDTEPKDTSIFQMGGEQRETVGAVTLEEIFRENKIGSCDFLKMDCEGAEYDILFYAPDHVLKSIKKIAMEWHKFDASHVPKKLAEFLTKKGFTIIGEPAWADTTGYLYAVRQ